MREYIDVFAWNDEDMPGLDPQVAMYRLNINPDTKPVKQLLAEYPDPTITKLYEDLPYEIDEVCMTKTSFEE